MVMKETKSDSVFSPAKPCQYYCAVANGYVLGMHRDWATAQKQVEHYSGATHKNFETLADAKNFLKQGGVYKPNFFATSKPHTSTSTNWSSRFSNATPTFKSDEMFNCFWLSVPG